MADAWITAIGVVLTYWAYRLSVTRGRHRKVKVRERKIGRLGWGFGMGWYEA